MLNGYFSFPKSTTSTKRDLEGVWIVCGFVLSDIHFNRVFKNIIYAKIAVAHASK